MIHRGHVYYDDGGQTELTNVKPEERACTCFDKYGVAHRAWWFRVGVSYFLEAICLTRFALSIRNTEAPFVTCLECLFEISRDPKRYR